MNIKYLPIIALIGGLFVPVSAQSSPGITGSPTARSSGSRIICPTLSCQSFPGQPRSTTSGAGLVNRLQRQMHMDEFKAKFWPQEPITQQNYYVQAKEDKQLLRRISKGEPVSQAEIDQALKRVNTDY